MEFRILGPMEVTEQGESVPLGGAKQRALLAVLLLHPNEVVSSDRLIDGVWAGEPPATALKTLHVYVSQLRKRLGTDVIVTRAPGYLLRVDRDDLDLSRFEVLVKEAKGAAPEVAAAKLREALALWRGPALAEFAYEPFAQTEIGRLEELRIAALEERIEAELALGLHADLVGELEALVAQHPLRERLRGPTDARPLPLRSPGRSSPCLSGRAPAARGAARDRSRSRAAPARETDPQPGPLAYARQASANTSCPVPRAGAESEERRVVVERRAWCADASGPRAVRRVGRRFGASCGSARSAPPARRPGVSSGSP